jgi:hypothetical protein
MRRPGRKEGVRKLQRKRINTALSVFDWRVDQLRSAGFAPRMAAELASGRSYDLHAILGLIDRGCPPHLALRILAPLDDGEPDSACARQGRP